MLICNCNFEMIMSSFFASHHLDLVVVILVGSDIFGHQMILFSCLNDKAQENVDLWGREVCKSACKEDYVLDAETALPTFNL